MHQSPTGHIHVGNARTAIFNYLFARHEGGMFIMRLDDTDLERSTEENIDSMLEDIRWLGLEWDEGFLKGGDLGPYRQSERKPLYDKYLQQLLNEGKAYRCFCTKDELEAEHRKAEAEHRIYRYSGACAHLSQEQIDNNLRGESPMQSDCESRSKMSSYMTSSVEMCSSRARSSTILSLHAKTVFPSTTSQPSLMMHS